MKFVYSTDWHGRSNNPISRKDDFPETVLRKVEWVVGYANKIGAINLIGGDILNRPDTSPTFISKLAKVLSGAKMGNYAILGNHDVYGGNASTFDRTPQSIVSKLEVIKLLDKEPIKLYNREETVLLSGAHYSYDVDGPDKKAYCPEGDKEDGSVWIHLTHGYLGNFDIPNAQTTKFREIEGTKADIILAGHEHSGFGIHKGESYTAVNPGSLLRVSCSVGNMSLSPSIVVIEVKGGEHKIELVPLPADVCRPADEVIDREAVISEKSAKEGLQAFSETLRTREFEDEDIFAALRNFVNSEGISEDVAKIIFESFETAQRKVGKDV